MAIGIMTSPLSDEEKKRREKFAANAPALGMVPNSAAGTPVSSNANAPKLGVVPNQQVQQQVDAPELGMGSNTNAGVPKNNNVSDKTIADEADALKTVYSDSPKLGFGANGVQRGNPDNKKFGLSVDNNAAVASAPVAAPAQALSDTTVRGFGVPNAPRKAYGEDSRRAALAMDIRPYEKMGGRLTTGQIALKNSILNGDDEKYANEQYQGQLGAASQVAQTQMTQNAANARAALGEAGSDKRFNTQFGFDVKKAQAANEIAQQKLGLDADKFSASLDVSKYNADTSRMTAETGQQALEKKGVLTEKDRNERIGEYRRTSASLDGALELADGMIANTDGLAGNIGIGSTYTPNFKDTTRKFNSDRKALLSQAFLANSDLLSGVLTDADAKELKNAFGNLQDTTIGEADYAKNLAKARALMQKTRDSTDERYQDVIPYMNKQGAASQPIDDEETIRNQELGNKYFGG